MIFQNACATAAIPSAPGKGAIQATYRHQINEGSCTILGSLDLDSFYQRAEPNNNRWDYGIGVQSGNIYVLWLEPHPASSSSEVKKILAKKHWLEAKLAQRSFSDLKVLTDNLKNSGESPFRWLYSGSCRIRRGSQEEKLLAKNGMRLPERQLQLPHLK